MAQRKQKPQPSSNGTFTLYDATIEFKDKSGKLLFEADLFRAVIYCVFYENSARSGFRSWSHLG